MKRNKSKNTKERRKATAKGAGLLGRFGLMRAPALELAETVTTKTLRMVFRNQDGRNVTMTLNDPKDGITQGEIHAAMDLIIDKNAFTSAGGDLVEKRDIKLISNTSEDLLVLPS